MSTPLHKVIMTVNNIFIRTKNNNLLKRLFSNRLLFFVIPLNAKMDVFRTCTESWPLLERFILSSPPQRASSHEGGFGSCSSTGVIAFRLKFYTLSRPDLNKEKRKAQVLRRRALEDLRGGFHRHSRAEATPADGA